MFKNKLTAAFAVLMALAASASATPLLATFSITSPINNIMDGGEFTGHISTNGTVFGPGFFVFCDDYQNQTTASPFSAYISDSTDLSKTRFGTTLNFSYNPGTTLSALDRYVMAAWLTTQYSSNLAAPTTKDIAIQAAIWTLLAQSGATPVSNAAITSTVLATMNTVLGQAVALKTNTALYNTIKTDLRIVTSSDVATAQNRYLSGQQEYLYLTPEPSSIVLAGLGLAGLAAIRKRHAAKA